MFTASSAGSESGHVDVLVSVVGFHNGSSTQLHTGGLGTKTVTPMIEPPRSDNDDTPQATGRPHCRTVF